MAQKFQTLFIDDLDGGEAAETVRFGLDGTDYEIDLSSAHTDELRRTLDQYVAHARRAGAAASRHSSRGGRRANKPADTHQVREWAREHGVEIHERGRVPAEVFEKYRAAGGK
jgi:Lsr2